MAANRRAGDAGGYPDCRQDRTPRTLLRCEHGGAVATAIARSTSSALVVLMLDDNGVLIVGSEEAVGTEAVADHCGRVLALAQTGCDMAVLVSLDSGLDGSTDAVRQTWLETRQRFAAAGIELVDWLLVAGDTSVSMAAAGREEP